MKKKELKLTESQVECLRTLNQEQNDLKTNLADWCLKKMEVEKAINDIAVALDEKSKEYLEKAREVVKSLGVDLDDAKAGNWNIDLATKTVRKTN